MHKASSTVFLHAVIVAGGDARGIAVSGSPVPAIIASHHIARVHAAGKRAAALDIGAALVSAAGRVVPADAVARATSGDGAGVVASAEEALAATPEDL
jgi:hypothetical protein